MTLQGIDFARPERRFVGGWALLAVGVVALLVVAGWERRLNAELRAFEADRVARQKAALQTKHQISSVVPINQTWAPAVQAELSHPWAKALEGVEESAAPPLYLLNLSADAAKRSITLEAEAPSYGQAIAFLETLRQQAGIQSVVLLSHEERSEPAQPRVLRFSAVAAWTAP